MIPQNKQQGSYIVEFALTSAIFMFLLFAVIEVGRLSYTWSALNLATQRGARVAVVCPLDDPQISQIAIFGSDDNPGSRIIPHVTAANIAVSYHDESGNESNSYPDISYVTVRVTNYTHELLIPILMSEQVSNTVLSPEFSTTLPVESLGYDPSSETRTCFS